MKKKIHPMAKNQIFGYINCGKCLDELPEGQSPKEYARLNVGLTPHGIQVWCVRHDCDVIHYTLDRLTEYLKNPPKCGGCGQC